MVQNTVLDVKPACRKIFILLVLTLFPGFLHAASIERPSDGGGPTPVDILVFVLDLDEVRTADQSFVANVFIEYRWLDPRLAHKDESNRVLPLKDVWNPRLLITNQQRVLKTFPEIVSITPHGVVTYRQRLWGTFSQPLDLEDFPFDKQKFVLQLAAVGYELNEIELRSDPKERMGIANEVSVTDWEIIKWQAGVGAYRPIPGGNINRPGFVFTFHAERKSEYFIVKVILPLILIVAMSWIVFWIDPEESGIQISVAITTMLTLIAYRFAVGSDLPKVSYLTRLDFFILAATILVFASLIEVIITSSLARKKRLGLARRFDRWSRILFPAFFTIVALKTFV